MANNKPVKNEMNKGNTLAKAMDFSLNIPIPIQKKNGNGIDNYVAYGANNLYPNYLLKLFNDSSIHKAIINAKVNYILGEKVISKATNKIADFKVNKNDLIEDLLRKVIKDYLIFNYFAIEVVYNRDGSVYEYNHIPANKVRSNINYTKFWFSEDWSSPKKEVIDFDSWTNSGGLESKLYFYSGYNPSVQSVYPDPEYSGAIKSIEIDIAIKNFHLNNINNNFSGNTILTFFRGEPTPEIKEEIVDAITGSYSGTNGDKIIFQFLEKDEKQPEVTQLNPTEWNEAYLTLKADTVEDITIAHEITSPMLVGIKTEGQLGGASELETAYSIFKQLWVRVKRREIVSAINEVISSQFGYIEIVDKEKLFKTELSDTLKEKVMTINEIRALEGLSSLGEEGNRLIGAPIVVAEESIKEAEQMGLSEYNDPLNEIGLSKDEVVIIEKHLFSNHIDYVLESNLSNDNLTKYFLETKITGKTFKDIQSDLKALGNDYSIYDIKNEYGRLVATRLIPDTKLLDNIDEYKKKYEVSDSNNLSKIEIRYSYEGPSDDRNRAFCHRLVRANKLYTREDIEKISGLFGYDVYNQMGGTNCRHKWYINSVVKK